MSPQSSPSLAGRSSKRSSSGAWACSGTRPRRPRSACHVITRAGRHSARALQKGWTAMDIPQMTLLAWLVVGAVAGFLASEIMGNREGLVMMVVLGIVGAIVGGWVAADLLK